MGKCFEFHEGKCVLLSWYLVFITLSFSYLITLMKTSRSMLMKIPLAFQHRLCSVLLSM